MQHLVIGKFQYIDLNKVVLKDHCLSFLKPLAIIHTTETGAQFTLYLKEMSIHGMQRKEGYSCYVMQIISSHTIHLKTTTLIRFYVYSLDAGQILKSVAT